MFIAADYPFLEIVATIVVFFAWVAWFWLLIGVVSDLFRRDDISGWGKAGWTLFLLVLPIIGVLVYLGTQGTKMAERRLEAAFGTPERAERVEEYAPVGAGDGAAAEIARAKELLDRGAINETEFERIKQKALA